MADSVEQCRLIPIARVGAGNQFPRAFDLNRAVVDIEDDDSFGDTSSQDSYSSVSNSESGASGNFPAATASIRYSCSDNGLIRMSDGDKVHDLIKGRFISGLGQLGEQTIVTAIRKNCYSSAMSQARAQAFQIYLRATQKKHSGNANVKYAWYATSKEGIATILSYGFGHCGSTESSGLYGSGIYLSPDNHPLERRGSQVYVRSHSLLIIFVFMYLIRLWDARLQC